jgi:glycosyltransferase involved in cell wall biosynthesis
MTTKIAIIRPNTTLQKLDYYNSQELGLAFALSKRGYDVDVVSVSANDEIECVEVSPFGSQCGRVRRITIPYRTLPIIDLALFNGLKNFLSSENYDFIHVNEYNEVVTFQVANYCNRSNTPFVIYQGVYRPMRSKALRLYNFLHRHLLLPVVTKNMCNALAKTTTAEHFLRKQGIERTKVIPVGLDVGKFTEGDDNLDIIRQVSKDLEDDTILITYVGDFSARRNIDLLLDIASLMHEDNVCFLFAGAGSLYAHAKFRIEQEQLANVYLPGPISQAQLSPVYSRSDIFLLASDYEIYGMVLLEAMFFSNAVISTPTAGAIDLVDESVGVLVEEKNAEEWATQIKHLVSHPLKLEQMKQNAKALVYENLTWDSVAENYDNEVLKPSINRINLTK